MKYLRALYVSIPALPVAMLFPFSAGAVTLTHTLGALNGIINGLIPIILGLTVLIFFWGLAMFLWDAGDSEKRGKGVFIMFMGVIVIFLMVSLWGIIGILQQTFKVDQGRPIIPGPIQGVPGNTTQ